mmetsp:Transcript_22339/g.39798  ORF Transcript_22339/g.39798 Transcript_22339/m.39798 type:complete len:231 (+) Transcript_22339:1447-2139(+)
MVSARALTVVSTTAIFSPEACICAFLLRSAVSFFSSASFPALESRRFWSPSKSFVQESEVLSANCFASTSFCMTKVRASEIVFCAAPAAASHATMAFSVSAAKSTSIPFRKGSSASEAFCTAASPLSTFSRAVASSSAAWSRSFCSLAAAVTSLSFFSAFVIRLRRPCSSSLRKPWALFNLTSTSFDIAPILFSAVEVAFSMASTLSTLGCSIAIGTAAAATFSTSPSAV